jgi:hypothetical protein
MDVETAAAGASARTARFRRWLAVLVGTAAITASLLAAMESDSGRREELAFVRASRSSLDIFSKIAGSTPRTQFQANGIRSALETGIEATARLIHASDADQEVFRLVVPVGSAQERASNRMVGVVRQMSRVPPDAPIDPVTRDLVTADLAAIRADLQVQNAQVDLADRYGTRQERAMFAIALVAISAVLLGLAGLIGGGRTGRVTLVVAAVALLLALGWGASAFLV